MILLLIVSFTAASVFAQDTYLRWAKQFPGTSVLTYGRGFGIETDANGNVYSVGIFTGTADFDPGPGIFNLTSYSTDVYISKLDMFGNFLWAKQITGSFGTLTSSFSLDKDFNIYVTGTFQATVDFDLGPGVFNLTANGILDAFVLKLTTDGDLLWVKQVGAASGQTGTSFTATDSFGNIYFTGSYRGTLDFDPGPGNTTLTSGSINNTDVFVCKLDVAGNFVWAGSFGGSLPDVSLGISCDITDNICVTGYFNGTADVDPGPAVFNLVSNGVEDMFMVKLDASGNFTRARSIGGAGTDYMYKTVTDDDGNIYATGFFRGTVDFDPGPGISNLVSPGGDAIFVLKLDNAGNFVWAKGMGGPQFNNWGYDIALDRLGNVYTTGFFIGPADFDPGPGSFILTSAAIDIFISKLDNNGNFAWAKSTGATATDQGLAITVDRFLNIYTTGHFGSTVDFDLEAPTYYLTAIPVSDPFVLKVAQCAAATYATLNEAACQSYTLNGQTYTAGGIYQQTIYNTAGCDSIITLNLTIGTKMFSTVNASICPGRSYYAGGASQTMAGIYRDTLQTVAGCDSVITTNLSLYPGPKPDLGPDGKLCTNIQTLITPGTFNSYLWQDNSILPGYAVSSAGKYWVTVTDANNCSATDTLNIFSVDTIPKNFLPPGQELCYGNVLRIAVPNYVSYQWSTGSMADFIDISSFGTYYLTVKDLNSCTGRDSITIQRKNCIYMAIPNAFTPDGNSLNDIFRPVINQLIKNFSFIVFNRYGQTIFETRDYNKGWDGTYKGKMQSSGSYIYRIKYTNIFGYETVENGSVILIR